MKDPQQATAEGAPRLLRTSGVANSIGLSARRSRSDFRDSAALPPVLLDHLSLVVCVLLGQLTPSHVREIRREARVAELQERSAERGDGRRRMRHAINRVQELRPGAIEAHIGGGLERDADPEHEACPG